MNDDKFVQRAYEIASKVDPHAVAPNPRVGCVIVKVPKNRRTQEPKIVGEGAHEVFGGPHAEVNAINQLKTQRTKEPKNQNYSVTQLPSCSVAKGYTVYLTLEPCDHFHGKKTPSCTDLLIKAAPDRVVIAALDPKFGGKSVEKLRAAGINVEVRSQELGVGKLLPDKGGRSRSDQGGLILNPFFDHYQKTKKPWITLKLGQSLDGRITSEDQYITNKKSLVEVHKMRAQYSAMLTTTETILQDDPRMNCRLECGERLRTYNDKALPWRASDPKLIILGQREIPQTHRVWDRSGEIYLFKTLDDFLTSELYPNLDSIMTECGACVSTLLLERGLVDEICLFVAPKVLGSGKMAFDTSKVRTLKSPDFGLTGKFCLHSQRDLDGDLELRYKRKLEMLSSSNLIRGSRPGLSDQVGQGQENKGMLISGPWNLGKSKSMYKGPH
ncbi:MAG TPA: bifunctional diaminohydroxyphosphoribosylaminopyrimidine deaminase/5-amino-6-(5-phosphoribosylamino)uracil reductase RibD [Candidatus Gracilibacteria bacterium]